MYSPEEYREPLRIHFDCKRLHCPLAALSDPNRSSTMNSTASGHFGLPPCQQAVRSISSEKQFLEAPLSHLVGLASTRFGNRIRRLAKTTRVGRERQFKLPRSLSEKHSLCPGRTDRLFPSQETSNSVIWPS